MQTKTLEMIHDHKQSSNINDKKIIFIVGPTASGKSDVAIALAKTFKGVIVNIDSIQVYQSLKIGAATPNEKEMQEVPHYLYSYIKEPHELTAGQYIRDFYHLLNEEKISGPLFVVGGTGFYIQALEKGMFDVPEVSEIIKSEIIEEFKNGYQDRLYLELKEFDPETKIHANDHYRIGRALEVKRAFGLKMTELQTAFSNKSAWPYPVLKLGLNFATYERELMIERLHHRTQKMLSSGMIEEVQNLVTQGFSHWSPLSSVGYLEVLKYLNGEIKKEHLEEAIVLSTIQLVKKQKTWFQRDQSIHWQNLFSVQLQEFENLVEVFLK